MTRQIFHNINLLLTNLLTPWSTSLLEKLTGITASQEIHHILWNAEGSLPHSQMPAICPCPEPHQSSLRPHNPLPEDPS
jgi:hypothetical protein